MYKSILVEKKDLIGIITLNRPKQNNTFNVSLATELNETLMKMDEDENVRVVVIKANGRNFSTGIALEEFNGKSHKEYREFLALMDKHNHTIAYMKKPVIASTHGYALANGAGLVFASDLAVASEDTKFGTTAINVGLICLGPAVPLVRTVGKKRALEMILTGEIINARKAEEYGLVNEVVPLDKLDEATFELASTLASKSSLALQIGKTGVYKLQDVPYHQGADYMTELFASLTSTEDANEGVRAFMEKRKPLWKGK